MRLFLALALTLAACSTPQSIPLTNVAAGHEVSLGRAAGTTNLFVQGRDEIFEYTRHGRLVHSMPLGKEPAPGGGLAFDNSGYLYATSDYFDVAVFAPQSRQLARTISNGIYEPLTLAVDRSDNLYVANGQNGAGDIAIFRPGASTPSTTITQGIYDPESLAFDSSGNLYVGNGLYADTVTVYSPNGTLLRTITDGVRDPESIALDANDDLFVANTEDGEGRTVTVYKAGTTKLAQTITDHIQCPQALTVDTAGNLYVANWENSTATIYAAKTRKLLRTISKNVAAPWVIAVDSTDHLYVGDMGRAPQVSVYSPERHRPQRTIPSDNQWIPIALSFGSP
ncbi:MAG TPA: NHL repeat-containing protein [Candidatus Cybelea sp.]|jgi:serine/threonine-protein kinase|nr:NHL repeat-containing protein [Candidatus Cybelea sp.]